MSQGHIPAPLWTPEQLEVDRQHAIGQFRETRIAEPLEDYLEAFDRLRDQVEEFLELTVDLMDMSSLTPDVLLRPQIIDCLRYVAGPPISLDDLLTLAGVASLSQRTFQEYPDLAAGLIQTVMMGVDRRRFPWVSTGSEPSEYDRKSAVLATAALIAVQRLATQRRTEGKQEQEDAVRGELLAAGFRYIVIPKRTIATPSAAPRPGEFTGEVKLGQRKADLVVGLWDGRIMAIECKVSNSYINSIKRLNNDAAAKAQVWREDFGRFVVPVAVISGLYKHHHLLDAQQRGLSLIWAHRLLDLPAWIAQTRIS